MDYKAATDEMMQMVRMVAAEKHHRLDGLRIAVIMQEEASESRGRIVAAFACKPSEKMRPLLTHENTAFVICIAQDQWNKMAPEKRLALVDHELCHCGIDSKGKAYMRPHDYEEFAEIVRRHGLWRGCRLEEAMRQTLLGLESTRQPAEVDTIGPVAPVAGEAVATAEVSAAAEGGAQALAAAAAERIASVVPQGGSVTVEVAGAAATAEGSEGKAASPAMDAVAGLVDGAVREAVAEVNRAAARLDAAAARRSRGAGGDISAELCSKAVEVFKATRRASTSSLQRRLRIGYTAAARILDVMEEHGIVGPTRGPEPREILVDLDTFAAPDFAGVVLQ